MSKISEIAENKKHYDGITLVERMKECHTSAVSIALIENFEARHNWETIDYFIFIIIIYATFNYFCVFFFQDLFRYRRLVNRLKSFYQICVPQQPQPT